MVFAIDVGNTNIVLGGYQGDTLQFVSRISTDVTRMEDQYAVEFASILSLYGVCAENFTGSILSSVVPPLTPILTRAVKKLFSFAPLVISPGIKTGLDIKIDNPATLGSDFVCTAVGALRKYKKPDRACIIIDLGTATKITALDKHGSFLGGSIMPGMQTSLLALTKSTAQLPSINLEAVQNVIGSNTVDCMKSGVLYGTASMIDGMIDRYCEILGNDATVIATGGLCVYIVPLCRRDMIVDHQLLLDGLNHIYRKNA